jgi:hypothetical protein
LIDEFGTVHLHEAMFYDRQDSHVVPSETAWPVNCLSKPPSGQHRNLVVPDAGMRLERGLSHTLAQVLGRKMHV